MTKIVLKKKWNKIGVYPTPEKLNDQFTEVVLNYLKKLNFNKKSASVLDLFAGDGRLGKSISESLIKNKYEIDLTYIEIEKKEISLIDKKFNKPTLLNKNVFEWSPKKRYKIIVSNPPYLILNSLKSKELGFDWNYAKSYGRNLYTLGIIKGLELCEEGGILAIISPFSWLRGEFSSKFRERINKICSDVFIKANKQRTVFKNVNQDIGIQIFRKRKKNDESETDWKFSYNGYAPKKILFKNFNKKSKLFTTSRVVVGPVVWNRKKEFLVKDKKNAALVIYGGNIGRDGGLHFDSPRYKDKQYIKKSALIKSDLFESPLILIRRIMRGIPGKWEIDSCLIDKKFVCTAENHVIVVEIPNDKIKSFKLFHEKLMSRLRKYYYLSGSPSISVMVVKQILKELEKSFDYDNNMFKKTAINNNGELNFIYA
jgi:hypothetical protein